LGEIVKKKAGKAQAPVNRSLLGIILACLKGEDLTKQKRVQIHALTERRQGAGKSSAIKNEKKRRVKAKEA
jgi:hypothetical protein